MNPFRRQLIEQAWANVGDWITPIQEDKGRQFFLLYDPWADIWKRFQPKPEVIHDRHDAFQFMAAGLALANLAGFEDLDPAPSGYFSASMLPSFAKDPYRGNGDPIQTISDWIDQHPHAAPRIAELESEMARDALGRVALTTMAGVVRPDGAVEAPQRRM